MRYVTPTVGQRGPPRDSDNSSLYFAPRMPSWLAEWIHNQVRFGLLDCGHFCDRNDHSAIVGDKMECVTCGAYIRVTRGSTLLERFGIVPQRHTEPPF